MRLSPLTTMAAREGGAEVESHTASMRYMSHNHRPYMTPMPYMSQGLNSKGMEPALISKDCMT